MWTDISRSVDEVATTTLPKRGGQSEGAGSGQSATAERWHGQTQRGQRAKRDGRVRRPSQGRGQGRAAGRARVQAGAGTAREETMAKEGKRRGGKRIRI